MPKTRLDDALLRSLQPPEVGQLDYWDERFSSFGIRLSQGGSKTFIVKMNNVRRTIGRYPIVSLAEARAEAKRMVAEKTLGKLRPQSLTIPQALNLFLDEKTKAKRSSTVKGYKRLLEKHFPLSGQINQVSHGEVGRRLGKIEAPSEHNHALAAAKTFFTWAHKRRYISDNPTVGYSFHSQQSRSRVLTDAELEAVWTAAEQTEGHFGTIVKLLILTGQRRGEIAALRTDYISNDTICLPATLTKNGREHTFPIGDLTASVSKLSIQTASPGHFLFPARGGSGTSFNGWSKSKSALDKASGVSDWTLHDLRRTFATNLAQMGTPPHVIERLLNHITGTVSGVAAIYNRASYIEEMRQAIELWETKLQKLIAA